MTTYVVMKHRDGLCPGSIETDKIARFIVDEMGRTIESLCTDPPTRFKLLA